MLNTLIKCPKAGLVYRYATSGVVEVYTIPTAWKAGKIVICAESAPVDINFGTAGTVTCVYGQQSGLVATVLTPSTSSGGHIPAETAMEFQLDADATHFAVISNGTGTWVGWRTDV